MAGRGRRTRSVTVLVLGLLVVFAGPAAADPPGPTRYEARVIGIDPPVEGIEARVLGGDSFLQLSVTGHEVVVPGYDGRELYLRFDPSGEVWENRRAVAYYQNQDRFDTAAAARPAEVGPDVPPEWVLVATDGTYAWHDHRIHWMSPITLPFVAADDPDTPARQVDPTADVPQLTTYWSDPIPIRVNGEEVGIVGELVYLPAASPIPALLALAGTLLVALVAGRRSARDGIVVAVGLGAVPALAISVPQVVALPAGVDGQWFQPLLPVVAMVVAAAGLAARDRSPFAVVVAGTAGVPLLGWVGANLAAVTASIVPPVGWPDVVTRIAVGMSIGGGLAALATGVRDLFSAPSPGGSQPADPEDRVTG